MSNLKSEPSSSAVIRKELPDEVDYCSDGEYFDEAEKREHHDRNCNDARSTQTESFSDMTGSKMIPVQVQSSSAQVSDNWETLQVRT